MNSPVIISKPAYEWSCTTCGGDATIAYVCGKRKKTYWNGKIKAGERICIACGKRRGIDFFGIVQSA